jgi:hypothetical protein
MIFSDIVRAINICHDADVPLFIWGPRGTGKSKSIKTYCLNKFHFNESIPYFYRDMRAAQMEASELRGLPDKDGDKFIYLPPSDLPHGNFIDEHGNTWGKNSDKKPEVSPFYTEIIESDKYKENGSFKTEVDEKWPLKGAVEYHKGILFLDEVNRAEDDVLQALFELILDKKTGSYELPSHILIVAAGNPSGTRYRTNTFISDAAFTSRWCHVKIEIDTDYTMEWMQYIKKISNSDISDKISQFCAGNIEHLIQTEDGAEELIIEPNPRSWEFVLRIETAIKNSTIFKDDINKNKIRTELLQGLVGNAIAEAYKSWSSDIYPKDIMNEGINTRVSKSLHSMQRQEVQGLMYGVANMATSIKDPTEQQIRNALSFCKWLINNNNYKDLAVGFCRAITNNELDSSLRGVALINPSIQRLLSKQSKPRIWYDNIIKDPELAKDVQITSWGKEISLNKG